MEARGPLVVQALHNFAQFALIPELWSLLNRNAGDATDSQNWLNPTVFSLPMPTYSVGLYIW